MSRLLPSRAASVQCTIQGEATVDCSEKSSPKGTSSKDAARIDSIPSTECKGLSSKTRQGNPARSNEFI